nr:MAG TPA: hypothetical protein [Caudoviricetes sp.]DAI18116.1 MAG TPA: hypothetical protein [Caudoviricetes sp.]DAI81987.1 MAG TPA: hypothetical protein [Caudoviricetes sp.]DAS96264.1 MAG TPA: hypothetical protein [Caudoviricetes sp.]DAZ63347.1 MAG TPA: hypothetical protein [Caudoviricetes sp.]
MLERGHESVRLQMVISVMRMRIVSPMLSSEQCY